MYTPGHFRERDAGRIEELVREHPFGLLIAGDELTHVPFLMEGTTLRAHVARANPVWRKALAGPVACVFRGPHGYVSPTWYTSPGEQVPTWNYAVAHAYGRAREMAREELLGLLADLAERFEPGPRKWRVEELEPAFRDELVAEIVGLAIAVERWDAKFKLSQNRSAEDAARVAEALAPEHGQLAAYVARALRDRAS